MVEDYRINYKQIYVKFLITQMKLKNSQCNKTDINRNKKSKLTNQ